MILSLKLLAALLIIVLISLLGKKLFRFRSSEIFVASGIFYVLVGVLLGKDFSSAITLKEIKLFSPILLFGFAYVGFFEGIQLNFREFLGLPFRFFLQALLLAGVVFTLSFAAAFLYFSSLQQALIFSALALCFSSAPAALALKEGQMRQLKMFAAFSAAAEIMAILLTGIIYLLETSGAQVQINLKRAAFSALFPVLLAVLTYFIFQLRFTEGETNALIMGVLAFMAGVCSYAGISPLFVGFAAGFIYVNLPYYIGTTRIVPKLYSLEKPFYLTYLLLTGTLLILPLGKEVLLGAVFALFVRGLSLLAGLKLVEKVGGGSWSKRFYQLLSMAGLYVVINLMMFLDRTGEAGWGYFKAFALAFLLNEVFVLIASWLKAKERPLSLTRRGG